MRKFRGKVKFNETASSIDRRAYGYFFESEGKSYVIQDDVEVFSSEYAERVIEYDFVEVYPDSVGQSTGLKDKNGVEIYEGDICKGNWPYADTCVVVWDIKRCGFFMKPIDGIGKAAYDKYYKMNANRVEIIGNIHTHKHLLEGDKI